MHLGVVVNYKADAELYQVVYEDDFEAVMDDLTDDIFRHDISPDRVKTVLPPDHRLPLCTSAPAPALTCAEYLASRLEE